MIAKTRAEFPLKVFTKRFTQNYCFQKAGWLFLPVAHQITGHIDFAWKHFAKNLMWCHIMQKIPWHCKFNILFILLKIAAMSAWNFKFQISFFSVWKSLKYYNSLSLSTYYEEVLPTKTTIKVMWRLYEGYIYLWCHKIIPFSTS